MFYTYHIYFKCKNVCIINKKLVYIEKKILFFFSLLKLNLSILHSSPHLTMKKVNFILILTSLVVLLLILDIYLIKSLSFLFDRKRDLK